MTISEILKELNLENGSNYKKTILEKHKDNELWKKVLYYAYNPNFNYYIKKIPDYNNGLDTIEDYEPLAMFEVLDKLKSRAVTGNSATDLLHLYLTRLSKDYAEVLELIIGRDIKSGISSTTINKIYKDLIPETPYCGCQSFNEKKVKALFKKDGKIISERKLDGRYVNILLLSDRIEMVSRSGKDTIIEGKFLDELKTFKEYINNEENVLTGELLMRGGFTRSEANGIIAKIININSNISVDEIKKANKVKLELQQEYNMTFEELQDLVYVGVWDIIPYENYMNLEYNVSRIVRLEYLESLLRNYNEGDLTRYMDITLVPYRIVKSYDEAIKHLKEELANGYEGTVVKGYYEIWQDGKKINQFKLKVEFNCELRIIGFNEGAKGTKLEGTLGSLICQSEDGLIAVRVGGQDEKEDSKKDYTKDYIWNNKHEFLDKIVEIKCNGISVNKDGGWNFLYPNYVTMRFDKNVANTLEEIKEIQDSKLKLDTIIKSDIIDLNNLLNS